MTSATTVERKSDRELVVTRTFNGPVRLVFKAWSDPALFQRWWIPQSFGMKIVSCRMDIRTGGTYRLEIAHPASEQPMAFFGRYLEVVPHERIVWTNEESENGAITTVTFEDRGDTTKVVLHELYPSKQALDDAIRSGSTGGYPEQFAQLETLLPALG